MSHAYDIEGSLTIPTTGDLTTLRHLLSDRGIDSEEGDIAQAMIALLTRSMGEGVVPDFTRSSRGVCEIALEREGVRNFDLEELLRDLAPYAVARIVHTDDSTGERRLMTLSEGRYREFAEQYSFPGEESLKWEMPTDVRVA